MMQMNDLRTLEESVGVALRTRDASHLGLVGHGEITIVLGWPTTEPQVRLQAAAPV